MTEYTFPDMIYVISHDFVYQDWKWKEIFILYEFRFDGESYRYQRCINDPRVDGCGSLEAFYVKMSIMGYDPAFDAVGKAPVLEAMVI